MIAGLSGSLLSHDALERHASEFSVTAPAHAGTLLRAFAAAASLGPASPPRAVYDELAEPLFRALGLELTAAAAAPAGTFAATASAGGGIVATVLVSRWDRPAGEVWRDAVRAGIAADVAWTVCLNGPRLRIVDARRTYARRYAEWDLAVTLADPRAAAWLAALAGADGFRPVPAALERAITLSDAHRHAVRASLQRGVGDALTTLVGAFASPAGRPTAARSAHLVDESLIVIYRILFLLFAEARGLVPAWHPTYRDAYTVEALRPGVERGAVPRGLWESLQAIARLAHRGCRAGTLVVPPFNGRLFSPDHAPLAERVRLDDGAVRQALLALTTRVNGRVRERISYADLGVEQLGGVYERVLDLAPAAASPRVPVVLVPTGRRKTTGSFYTPRSLTEFVVRRTLAPLVEGRDAEAVLRLRVLDPAMGSGAFLVAACRYLGDAYERALVEEGHIDPGELHARDRATFRRTIAQRCLYGVDLNPMAVQLGRLSLWLATLSGDRPLTFLDHHLRAGNSLVGAALTDVVRRQPRRGRRAERLPLFDWDDAASAIGSTVRPRLAMAASPAGTLDEVRALERQLAGMEAEDAPLTRWKRIADLWCAPWFGAGKTELAPAVFSALLDGSLGERALPFLSAASAVAARERFFHWTLEFPEVFHDVTGLPRPDAGFDAIVGNPPWEMLRGDHDAGSSAAARLMRFARESGTYRLHGDGHGNLYQLFVERALAVLRPGGRAGLVLPSGLATDHGSAALRRHVLDRTEVDTCVSLDNRCGVFPIHRGLRFLLLTLTAGGRTAALPYRSGVTAVDRLDAIADAGDATTVRIPRELIERLSGEQLAIPEVRSTACLSLASRLVHAWPPLGDPSGWNVHFGRELNATDDRRFFGPPGVEGAWPVIEGKHIEPFVVHAGSARWALRPGAAPPRGAARAHRHRLAYRDVASASNRLTLIAAIVPPGVVTTHTLFCSREDLPQDTLAVLCALFNSFVANWLVRLRVGTHVSTAIVHRLPMPVVERGSQDFDRLHALATALAVPHEPREASVEVQALAARVYGLAPGELEHVLDAFPLVDRDFRAAVLRYSSSLTPCPTTGSP